MDTCFAVEERSPNMFNYKQYLVEFSEHINKMLCEILQSFNVYKSSRK